MSHARKKGCDWPTSFRCTRQLIAWHVSIEQNGFVNNVCSV